MRRTFPSLQNPAKFGYAYDSEEFDHRATINGHFRQFETYGDGLCQHSGDWSVQVDHLTDYLASLATAMLADPEIITHACYDLTRAPSEKDIAFAASIVFKPAEGTPAYEKKTRYFSLEQSMVSSNPSKRYDTRYHEIEPWCDGSPDAIYRILIPEYAKGMEFYAYADAIRNWCLAGEKNERPYFQGLPAVFLKWFDCNTDRARQLRYAYNACTSVCKAYQARSEAETALSNLHWPAAESVTNTEESAA